MSGAGDLSEAQLGILRLIAESNDLSTVAKKAGVSPASLGMEVARLQLKGYIDHEGRLSDKGLKAAGSGTE